MQERLAAKRARRGEDDEDEEDDEEECTNEEGDDDDDDEEEELDANQIVKGKLTKNNVLFTEEMEGPSSNEG